MRDSELGEMAAALVVSTAAGVDSTVVWVDLTEEAVGSLGGGIPTTAPSPTTVANPAAPRPLIRRAGMQRRRRRGKARARGASGSRRPRNPPDLVKGTTIMLI